jgi:hypothetical protein
VAAKTNNFEDIDKDYAYRIWLVEKEFNVGPITEDFLVMKFWNLIDNDNASRYNDETKPNNNSRGTTHRFGS